MRPMPLADATRQMVAPSDWDEKNGKCETLDIHDAEIDGSPVMISAWRLDEGELEKLAAGAPVYLRIWGTGHPVVSIYTGDPTESTQ